MPCSASWRATRSTLCLSTFHPVLCNSSVHAVAAVAHANPVPAHSPGLSLGASAGNVSLRARNKGSNAMVLPVRRRLRTKTPPIAQQRVPSMEAVSKRKRMGSKGPPPKAVPPHPVVLQAQGGGPFHHPGARGGGPPGRGNDGTESYKNLFPPGLPRRQGPRGAPEEGEQDQAGLAIVVHECSIGHVYLE